MSLEKRRNRDIQNLFIVLGGAVVCAGLLAFLFIHKYGPNGHYTAGQTILNPSTMTEINAALPKKGKSVRFILDHVEFSYWDPQKGEVRQEISMETYQKFYKMVESEKSIETDDTIKNLFLRRSPASLTTNMQRVENSGKVKTDVFQDIQFVQEDYFRVLLHEKSDQGEWAYFFRKGIFKDLMKLFTQSPTL